MFAKTWLGSAFKPVFSPSSNFAFKYALTFGLKRVETRGFEKPILGSDLKAAYLPLLLSCECHCRLYYHLPALDQLWKNAWPILSSCGRKSFRTWAYFRDFRFQHVFQAHRSPWKPFGIQVLDIQTGGLLGLKRVETRGFESEGGVFAVTQKNNAKLLKYKTFHYAYMVPVATFTDRRLIFRKTLEPLCPL